jgi:hypothetical protein
MVPRQEGTGRHARAGHRTGGDLVYFPEKLSRPGAMWLTAGDMGFLVFGVCVAPHLLPEPLPVVASHRRTVP